MTITRHLGATETNTIGTETPLVNHLTHPFTPQLDWVRPDAQLRTMREPEMGRQNGGDACYTFISGTSAELPRGAASGSSALVAPVRGSRATLDMQMTRGRERELASFSFLLPPRLT